MAKNYLGEIRRSQVLDYGPGAIVDFRAGTGGGGPVSVVAAGLEHWDEAAGPPFPGNDQVISEPRLQGWLSVNGFRLPPVDDRDNDSSKKKCRLIGARFPTRLQCPSCNEIKSARLWDKEPGDPSRWCTRCSNVAGNRIHVIPVRFVTACANGHLDEFPWDGWLARADHKKDCKRTGRMKLESRGAIGLSGLYLVCIDCMAGVSMEGVLGEKSLSGTKCKGYRPWLGSPAEECDEVPRALQRGASNLYFPVTVSALSIPPWSDKLQKLIGINWAIIVNATREERSILLRLHEATLEKTLGMSLQDVLENIDQRVKEIEKPKTGDLKFDEYKNFIEGVPGTNNEGVVECEFEVRQQRVPKLLRAYVDKLARVVRLREVRALKTFSRIYEPATPDEPGKAEVGTLSSGPMNWLPAVEVRGEGFFLTLNHSRLSEWESNIAIRERAKTINEYYQLAFAADNQEEGRGRPEITARYLLLHSLSHALLRYVSIECGYETASLRERVYVDTLGQEMCGLLIYTSTSDSEGTLGGLARQAEPQMFANILLGSLESVSWCSSDPLCISGITSASESFNNAACHSCMLVPETSCETYNRFLDRAMLIGNPQEDIEGFFSGLIKGLNGGLE